jgi:two-component system, chemotaxis family, CheB/CheR fusion protein
MNEIESQDGAIPAESVTETGEQSPFLVVALGASAGGLHALQQFFEHLPPDSGMAFVVVMHLAPDHESHLASLLQGFTQMPVQQVNDTIALQPNCVFVGPPNRNLFALGEHLGLAALEEQRSERAPIDYFFRTLGSTLGTRAVCIVLSGSGSDGTLGLRQVKEAGGLTVAQDPADAEYDAMPQSAISTGQVELVLPAAEIAAKLVEYARTAKHETALVAAEEPATSVGDLIQEILEQVCAGTGYDFGRYKRSTIMRRIHRRMQIYGHEQLTQYLDFLHEHDDEVQKLSADFLISVTNFFRDVEAFAALERDVIPGLFRNKHGEDQVRVWVTGCATGEEAYSIGILLLEYAQQLQSPPSVQVFATDLSEIALRRAREGLYPESIELDVSPARLARFFFRDQGGYRVRHELRELILFAPQNLLKDPPFSKIDLISCRNVLIYMQRSAQKQLLELFHYSLRPDGYLFLGSAETIEDARLFRDLNRRHGIFQRQPVASHELRLPSLSLSLVPAQFSPAVVQAEPQRIGSTEKLYTQIMERYGPPSLVVNADYDIIYFSDGVNRYLQQPRGEPTDNVLRRIREELRIDLTSGLYRAFEHREATLSAPVAVPFEREQCLVTVDVRPAQEENLKGFVLVMFHEHGIQSEPGNQEEMLTVKRQSLTALEEELQEVRRRLQAAVEDYEISKEEMRAANEELLSMNEELRSTAEELETSKEELQSINEELLTVNQENKGKIDELSQMTSDLQNLLAATDIATLLLDRELNIKRFTPRICEVFNVLAGDRGRPLAHITHKLRYPTLLEDAGNVLQTLTPIEQEVSSEDDRWYVIRILPYRAVDDHIGGVLITLVDITRHRR